MSIPHSGHSVNPERAATTAALTTRMELAHIAWADSLREIKHLTAQPLTKPRAQHRALLEAFLVEARCHLALLEAEISLDDAVDAGQASYLDDTSGMFVPLGGDS